MNKQVQLDMRIAAPVNKSSWRGNILDLCTETRKRALRMNEGHDMRLQSRRKTIDRRKREILLKEKRTKEKLDTSVKHLQVYQTILEDYKYDNLVVINRINECKDRSRLTWTAKKRINAETKLINSGFSMKLFKTKIDSLSGEKTDSYIRKHRLQTEYALAKAQSDIMLSREGTFSAVIRDYKHKSHETSRDLDDYKPISGKVSKLPTSRDIDDYKPSGGKVSKLPAIQRARKIDVKQYHL